MEIIFNKGIPGFEDLRKFDINALSGNERIKIVKSLDEKEVSFVTVNPFDFYGDYEIKLSDEVIKELKIGKEEEVLLLNIVTVGKSLDSSTINLQAPLVINVNSKLGKQYIMQNSKYETKHPLIRRD